ncbi:MAG: phage holin family protein [Eubacteriales bacterium]|nr:phage holin family protein [Eubacteriales bacterium]
MEQILNYVKPELIVVTVVLYFIGMAVKQLPGIKDKFIPSILGAVGIVICAIYVFASCHCHNGQDIAMAAFTAITQGVLVAGLSTYVNQLLKQSSKKE